MEGFKRGTRMLLKAAMTMFVAVTVMMTVKVSAYAMEYGTWVWPTPSCRTKITTIYQPRHPAIDIGATYNSDIVAAKAGVVEHAFNNCSHIKVASDVCVHEGYKDGGNKVIIRHDDGTITAYCHMIKGSVTVERGQRVSAGQLIGKVGESGHASGPHLHYAVRYGGNSFWDNSGQYLDPMSLNYGYGIHFTSCKAENINLYTAKIIANLDAYYKVSECGFYFGKTSTNMDKHTEQVNNVNSNQIYYDLGTGKWTGDLEPNTTYYYQIYFVSGGITYKSTVNSFKTKSTEPTPLYYLDLNGFLDKIDYALLNADETGNDLGTFGTADIFINGVKVADDVNDYWEAYPVGTKYEIKDIKAKGNTHYSKVLKGSLSGTIQAKRCNVWLYFESNKKQKVQNKITAKDITITAKTKAQTVNIKASALGGAKLSYSGKKATVNSKGVATVPAKYVGCLIIKVTSAATNDYLQTTKDVRIYVQPLAPTLKKVTSNYKKTIYVNWSTVKICDGYEVWYSTRQDMKNAKCVVVKGNNKKSVEFKKTSGKTYYIRVRAYKKVNGNKNYSAYSNRKKVKVK